MRIGKSQVDDTIKVFGNGPVVIGDRSRIDAGVIICAGEKGVYIGDNVHIAHNVILAGTSGKIEFSDFSAIGADGKVYTASEDPFYGLTNPTVPTPYRRPKVGDVFIGKHVLVYTNVVICPGVTLGEGCAVGAFTVVKDSLPEGVLFAGNKQIGTRNVDELRQLEQKYLGMHYYSTNETVAILEEYMGLP